MALKKICILDTGKEWGGGTNSLLELLKRVDKKRYAFSALFYNNYRMGSLSDIKSELERLGVEFSLLERGGKRAYIKGLKEAGRALLFFSRDLKKRYVFHIDYLERILPDSKRIASYLNGRGFDLLYMNNQPSSNLEGILASKALGIPCIQHSRVDVRLNPVEAEAVNNWVSKVICVSKGVMEGLTSSGVLPEKCTVVYNGIDGYIKPKRSSGEVRKELGIKEGSLIIGTAGSLIKRKRVDMLLKAFSILRENNAYCLVVGEGPEMENLENEAAGLGIRDRVIFTGFSTDALSYINSMDIFALPSEKEGLPRVILEAMLMGKPVLAFDVTGTGELVINDRTGFLVKDETPEAFAGMLEKMIRSKADMQRMGEAGRMRVAADFGIDRYVSGVTGVFEEVLS